MRKISKLLSVVALTAISVSMFAQNYPAKVNTTATSTTSEYVTVGSQLPYYVTPDATIDGLITLGAMNNSNFKWIITTNADVAIPAASANMKAADGSAALGAGGAADYYTNNEVTISWLTGQTPAQANPYKIKVTEHSIPATGVFADGCDGNTQTRFVHVLPVPTIGVNSTTASIACGTTPGAGIFYYVPLKLTGIGPWDVTYSVTYNGAAYAAGGTTATVGTTQSITDDDNGTSDVYTLATTQSTLNAQVAGNTAGIPLLINGGGANSGYGSYVVTITDVKDKISKKSLTSINGTVNIGEDKITVYVIPTPNTGAVQHVAN